MLTCLIPSTHTGQPAELEDSCPLLPCLGLFCDSSQLGLFSEVGIYWCTHDVGLLQELQQPLQSCERVGMHHKAVLTYILFPPNPDTLISSISELIRCLGYWEGQERSVNLLVPLFTNCDLE